jgi:lipopolysaccharide transport system ATP-binding protein
MSEIAIQVEHLYKQYKLGAIGTGTISHDVTRWWYKVRGKEDPFQKVTVLNDRTQKDAKNNDYIWALDDINFEVKQGEVLGIVGKNGAGKSTLLKILSKVTSPTKGMIKVNGRIASLLEVGTGFHPELSGRENIYLNGAILGMSKQEIKSKFDEIVDFSGVDKYIDTPVKRYSSGMYVRLAFAVAAHLESEILIIDEVLAVGDAEFQKKCLGKMKDVSAGEGRTVLFVSHNMTAVNTLCNRCIYLKNGGLFSEGTTDKIVDQYLNTEHQSKTFVEWAPGKNPGDDVVMLKSARVIDEKLNKVDFTSIHNPIGIEIIYQVLKEGYCPIPNVHLYTASGECAFVSGDQIDAKLSRIGQHKAIMWIPKDLLNDGTYVVNISISTLQPITIHLHTKEALTFEVIEDLSKRNGDYIQKIPGVLRPKFEWVTNLID